MSGRKSGKKTSPQNVQPKRKKRRVKSKGDNEKNVYQCDGVSTSQILTSRANSSNMNTQNSNIPGLQNLQGQFMPMQGASNNMQGQSSTPMMFSYSPPPQPPSQMSTQMGSQMAITSNYRPDWANEILQNMTEMKKDLSKLSSMEETLNTIHRKVETLENKVNQVENVAKNCEKSCEFLNSSFEDQKNELREAKSSISSLKKQCSVLEKKASDCVAQKQKVQDKLNDLEARSMRDNLLFLGIEETQAEDCSAKVKQFCEDELQLSHDTVDSIVIDRAHRIRKVKVGSVRPIVVKFNRYGDREKIRLKANELKATLRNKHYTVKPQIPYDVMEKRKPLYSVFEAELAKGNRCKFVLDKLYINGRLYETPNPSNPPNLTDPST